MCYDAGVTTLRTARERARSEVRAEILAAARRHLATDGAAGLSLRAVARELGLVSSAVYRYFENRDALLTALIVESYDALGDAVDAAIAAAGAEPPRGRWVAAALAVRAWAVDRPQEYALLYGSPVPGYEAPQDTVAPGTRVSLALVGIVRDAQRAGALSPPSDDEPPAEVRADLERLAGLVGDELPVGLLFATLLAWTQLFGLLSFELFGQTRGVVEDHEAFFAAAVAAMAGRAGL